MIAVIVSTITRIANSSLINPSTAVFIMLFTVYFTAAVLHPREFSSVIPGILYFLCLPSTFVLLQVYALFNLNNVSWGTREIKNYQESKPKTSKINSILNKIIGKNNVDPVNEPIRQNSWKSMETIDDVRLKIESKWTDHPLLVNSPTLSLDEKEIQFFNVLIKTYLSPIIVDVAHKAKITDDLRILKNNCSFSFCMVNAVWLAVIFNLQFIQTRLYKSLFIELPIMNEGEFLRYEPLSFMFVIIFIFVTVLQYFAMLWHRYKTFLHMIVTASVPNRILKRTNSVIEGNKYGSIINGVELANSHPTTSLEIS
jgi:chitin synthase